MSHIFHSISFYRVGAEETISGIHRFFSCTILGQLLSTSGLPNLLQLVLKSKFSFSKTVCQLDDPIFSTVYP